MRLVDHRTKYITAMKLGFLKVIKHPSDAGWHISKQFICNH